MKFTKTVFLLAATAALATSAQASSINDTVRLALNAGFSGKHQTFDKGTFYRDYDLKASIGTYELNGSAHYLFKQDSRFTFGLGAEAGVAYGTTTFNMDNHPYTSNYHDANAGLSLFGKYDTRFEFSPFATLSAGYLRTSLDNFGEYQKSKSTGIYYKLSAGVYLRNDVTVQLNLGLANLKAKSPVGLEGTKASSKWNSVGVSLGYQW